MLTFACRSLGNDCAWKHSARTEDLLADEAALHLREAHGIPGLGSDLVAKIKRSFGAPEPRETGDEDLPVMKEYRCDLGAACGWHYIAQTEELIADGVALHAREAHGITEFTPALKARVGNSLRIWKG